MINEEKEKSLAKEGKELLNWYDATPTYEPELIHNCRRQYKTVIIPEIIRFIHSDILQIAHKAYKIMQYPSTLILPSCKKIENYRTHPQDVRPIIEWAGFKFIECKGITLYFKKE